MSNYFYAYEIFNEIVNSIPLISHIDKQLNVWIKYASHWMNWSFQDNIGNNILTSNINVWEKQIEWALGLRYKTIYSCGYLTKLFFLFCKWAFSKPNRLYKKFFYIITFILYGDLALTLLWNPLSQNDLYHTLIKWSMTNPAIYIWYQKEKIMIKQV